MTKNDGPSTAPIGALIACVAVSLVMLALEPVPGGRHYEYALLLSLALTAIWFLHAASPRIFFGKGVLAVVLLCGLVLGAVNLSVISSDSEIIRTYRTVFDALEAGKNPYTAGTIFHEIESRGPVLGNFNYPPLEIFPYYLAYRIAGTWNITVLTVTMLLIHMLCCGILLRMFPRIRPVLLLPFMPMILLGEIKTTVALTLLATCLILWTIKKDAEAPRTLHGYVIAVLFGLGLMTKFLILPLMAAYYAHKLDAKDVRSLARTGVEVAIALGTAVIVMAPFGVIEVLKNTVLFNIVLEDRAALTTFYPNILSGPLAWLGLQGLFPIAASAILALSILAARKLGLLSAMLTASYVFLFVASTPEPQFLPVLFFLVVVAQGMALETTAPVSQRPGRSPEVERGGRRISALLKGTIAAGMVCFGLIATPVFAAEAAFPSSSTDARVPFSLAARMPGPGSGCSPFSLTSRGLPTGAPDAMREDAPAETVSRPEGKKLRAWIEQAAFSIATTVNYWAGNSFPEDRDFGLDIDSQISRVLFLEGWRFDSNQFSLNWSHILGGATYYQFGRSNQLSWLYSWLMSVVGSSWWEIVGEPKEVVSINDQIMTGLGGFAAGEPWYQIGHFLCHQPNPVLRVLSFLNPVVKLNHFLDRKYPATEGYVQPGWHEMNVFLGARRIAWGRREAGTDVYFGFNARLIGIPEYGKPGELRRAVTDAYFSEMTLDFATRGGHAEETRFLTKAVAWGRFVQKIGDSGNGYSLTLGLGSSFELFKKRPLAAYDAAPVPVKTDLERLQLEEPRAFTEKLAILHVAGPVLDGTVFRRGGLRLRTVVEAYLDFALVNSAAINDYSRFHDISGLKTTVFYYGYYYGFGGTLSASARLDWKHLRVHGLAGFGAWRSIDFLDRFQDEVTNNAHLSDMRARFIFGVGWKVPGTPLEFFADVEGVRRRGRLAEMSAHSFEKKAYAGLSFTF